MKITYNGKEFEVRIGIYEVNDLFGHQRANLAVWLEDLEYGEPFAFLTVNFDYLSVRLGAFLDINNAPWAPSVLKASGLAEKTALTRHSGFCEYPLWVFDEKKLREIDEKTVEEYLALNTEPQFDDEEDEEEAE